MMLYSSILQSVEFYVVASVVAAAVVAMLGKSADKGAARQYLLPGELSSEDAAGEPSIEFRCCENGDVRLIRQGIKGVNASGAVSLAIEVVGFDIRIKERIVEGRRESAPVNVAAFTLDFMGKDHYFITYESPLSTESTPLFASLTLHNRVGISMIKRLQ